jgi:hypothetical protein
MNLIRTLLGLIITCTMLPITVQAFRFTSNIKFEYNEINDEIALMQLREILLIAYDMNIYSDELNFRYKNKDFSLSLVNNKLLLQPGTQIFLNDVDNIVFKTKNDFIYIEYERNNETYERLIGKQEGLYIDDFSNCDVSDDERDNSEE